MVGPGGDIERKDTVIHEGYKKRKGNRIIFRGCMQFIDKPQ
jgi:hypothetical protein